MKEAIDSVAGSRGQGQGLGSSRASKWDSRMTLDESVASSPVYKVPWRVQGAVNERNFRGECPRVNGEV